MAIDDTVLISCKDGSSWIDQTNRFLQTKNYEIGDSDSLQDALNLTQQLKVMKTKDNFVSWVNPDDDQFYFIQRDPSQDRLYVLSKPLQEKFGNENSLVVDAVVLSHFATILSEDNGVRALSMIRMNRGYTPVFALTEDQINEKIVSMDMIKVVDSSSDIAQDYLESSGQFNYYAAYFVLKSDNGKIKIQENYIENSESSPRVQVVYANLELGENQCADKIKATQMLLILICT